jgi:hypothetical protein
LARSRNQADNDFPDAAARNDHNTLSSSDTRNFKVTDFVVFFMS